MEYRLDRKGERRLAAYFDRIGNVLRTAPQRAWFAADALDSLGRRIASPVAVGDLAVAIGQRGFRRVPWREGTKGKLASRFATEHEGRAFRGWHRRKTSWFNQEC